MKRLTVIVLALLALVGLIGLIVGAFVAPKATLAAYLGGFGFGLSLMLGTLLLVLIAHLTGARWMLMYRRLAEVFATTAVVLAVAFIPIALTIDSLYQWAFPLDSLHHHVKELVLHKRPWLNTPFFLIRAVLYFAIWIVAAELFLAWSKQQEPDLPRTTTRIRTLAGVATWPLVFSLTFATIDWFMSVDAEWFSTMYPVYFFSGSFLAALALMAVFGHAVDRTGLLRGELNPSHYHALGKLTLTLVIFWAYIAFSQFMLIWAADLPHEVPWYIERMEGFWGFLSIVLIVGHFAIPFFLLLSRALKRRGRLLAGVGIYLLVMHWIDIVWLIVPTARHGTVESAWWAHFAALFLFTGLLGLAFMWRASRYELLPTGDPFLPTALRYHST